MYSHLINISFAEMISCQWRSSPKVKKIIQGHQRVIYKVLVKLFLLIQKWACRKSMWLDCVVLLQIGKKCFIFCSVIYLKCYYGMFDFSVTGFFYKCCFIFVFLLSSSFEKSLWSCIVYEDEWSGEKSDGFLRKKKG